MGAYAAGLLDHPLPWTKMRQVYRLLGLVRRHGAQRVDAACARALDVETVNVGLIERMLLRGFDGDPTRTPGTENSQLSLPITGTALASTVVPAAGRFVRDATEFATGKPPLPSEPERRPS